MTMLSNIVPSIMVAALTAATILPAMAQQLALPLPPAVLVTMYSRHGGLKPWPGRQPWAGTIWIDHRKIGLITSGHFVTLKLTEGDHSLAGMSFSGHESPVQNVISVKTGERYFVRLFINNKAIGGVGTMHYVAEQVTCKEAYDESATAEPVKLKHIQKTSLDLVARDAYFPQCNN